MRLAACLVALLTAAAVPQNPPQPVSPQHQAKDADEMVQSWLDAVRLHATGQNDDQIKWLGSLPTDQWKTLNAGIKNYFGRGLGSNPVIDRAAIFHMDAAMFGPPAPASQLNSAWTGGLTPSLFRTQDGELEGREDANWNWILARKILDQLKPAPRSDPFAVFWYHAAASYLLWHGYYGELGTHLDHAGLLFPTDARIAFDRGCLAEALGMPRSQFAIDSLLARRPGSRGSATFVPGMQSNTNPRNEFQTARAANDEAEKRFRQALQVDPTFAEARIRLARLLELKGQHDTARKELETALRGTIPDPVVLYYGHLFAARAELALKNADGATAHIHDALALFPDAQSALIVQSQLALLKSDAEGALAPVRHLAGLVTDPNHLEDPWWIYDTGSGRLVEFMLAEMKARAEALK
jgi:tetratricopeptide (TPR) repeat protein